MIDDNKEGESQSPVAEDSSQDLTSDLPSGAKEISGSDPVPAQDSKAVVDNAPSVADIDKPESICTDKDRKKIERLKKLLARNPDNDRAKREVRKLFTSYENQVREAFKSGEYRKAVSYIRQMLEVAPENEKLLELQETVIEKMSEQ